jgi:hypothetical protein
MTTLDDDDCAHVRTATCVRCGREACARCERCEGCGQVICSACDTDTGGAPFAYAGDRWTHPHNDG